MNSKEVNLQKKFVKVFVVGDPGTGKSIFASTFPTPAYLLNFDNTEISYAGRDFEYENFDTSPKGWIQSEKEIKMLCKLAKEDKPFPYKTVVLDSTTSWTDLAMERSLQLDPKRSPTGGPLWNVHYGMVKNLVEGYIRKLLELPCNFVLIGHMDRILDSDTGALLSIVPMLTGQLSIKVPSYFDEVYYTDTRKRNGNTQFILRTIPSGYLKARSRLSGKKRLLPDIMENDYNKLLSYLQNIK